MFQVEGTHWSENMASLEGVREQLRLGGMGHTVECCMIDVIPVITDFPNTRFFLVGGQVSGKSAARLAYPPTLPTGP